MKIDEQTVMTGNMQRNENLDVRIVSKEGACGMNRWRNETSRTKGY
jgi:hypothetical protein